MAIFNPLRIQVRLREDRALSLAHIANQWQRLAYTPDIQTYNLVSFS